MVSATKFVSLEIELPEWIDIVKTATFKELAPYDPDWYYIRAASMARNLRDGLGVDDAFKRVYGGSKRNGSRRPHFVRAMVLLPDIFCSRIVEIDPKG
ncbi:hypothetical protein ACLB2K_040605 [Fragaria x ananassa]